MNPWSSKHRKKAELRKKDRRRWNRLYSGGHLKHATFDSRKKIEEAASRDHKASFWRDSCAKRFVKQSVLLFSCSSSHGQQYNWESCVNPNTSVFIRAARLITLILKSAGYIHKILILELEKHWPTFRGEIRIGHIRALYKPVLKT